MAGGSRVLAIDPGKIIYEDPFQIGVIPYKRELPTPLPEGVVLGQTSAGSKCLFGQAL
ncbi:hypothetical protein [Arthrobacter monumenti]